MYIVHNWSYFYVSCLPEWRRRILSYLLSNQIGPDRNLTAKKNGTYFQLVKKFICYHLIPTSGLYELLLFTAFRPSKQKIFTPSKVKFENETFGKGKKVSFRFSPLSCLLWWGSKSGVVFVKLYTVVLLYGGTTQGGQGRPKVN